jgi:hypothetical protein
MGGIYLVVNGGQCIMVSRGMGGIDLVDNGGHCIVVSSGHGWDMSSG